MAERKRRKKLPVPVFSSPQEEAEFWDTHDSMDYQWEDVPDVVVLPRKLLPSAREVFRRNVQEAAHWALDRAEPRFVKAFKEALGPDENVSRALEATATIPTQSFQRWRRLIIALLDVDLAMTRVRSALKLHGTVIDQETLRMWSMNRGSWVDYHLATWLLFMDGLLERVRKLVAISCRELIRPFNPGNWQAIEKELTTISDQLLSAMAQTRDPIAHGGGPIETISPGKLLEGMTLQQTWPDVLQILGPQSQFQERWHEYLQRTSILGFAWIEKTFEQLNAAIPWDKVRQRWA